jgi:hypothetical protein
MASNIIAERMPISGHFSPVMVLVERLACQTSQAAREHRRRGRRLGPTAGVASGTSGR